MNWNGALVLTGDSTGAARRPNRRGHLIRRRGTRGPPQKTPLPKIIGPPHRPEGRALFHRATFLGRRSLRENHRSIGGCFGNTLSSGVAGRLDGPAKGEIHGILGAAIGNPPAPITGPNRRLLKSSAQKLKTSGRALPEVSEVYHKVGCVSSRLRGRQRILAAT